MFLGFESIDVHCLMCSGFLATVVHVMWYMPRQRTTVWHAALGRGYAINNIVLTLLCVGVAPCFWERAR